MDPYHQISFTETEIPNLCQLLKAEGFSTTESNDSWLSDEIPGLTCERDGKRSGFAVLKKQASHAETTLVYVNRLDDDIVRTIREILEKRGAVWTYYDKP